MRQLVIGLIAALVFAATASAFDAVHGEKYFTVKVKNAHKSEAVKCREMCVSLEKDGIMAFCVRGDKMNEVFAGIYETKERAEEAALKIKETYKIRCAVTVTTAAAGIRYKGGLIVNVPSGIWVLTSGTARKIFGYGKCMDARLTIMENAISVSPSGGEIAFYFNGAIHITDLATLEDRVVAAGLSNPGAPCRPAPKWSPDGKVIAYIEEYGAGKGSGIKIVNKDGSGETSLLSNRRSKEHVASFEWHPGKNVIYFVASGAGRRVPIDGKLCLLGMDRKVKDLVIPAAGKEIDRHFRFQGKTIIISENTYKPGLDDNYISKEKVLELN